MPKITLNEELSQHRLPKAFYCDITTVSSRVQFKTVSLLIFIRKMRHIRNLSYYLHFPFCTKMPIILLCRRLKNDDSKQETRNSVKEYQSKACYLVNFREKSKVPFPSRLSDAWLHLDDIDPQIALTKTQKFM